MHNHPPAFLSFVGTEYLFVAYAALTVFLLIVMGKLATSNLALVPTGLQNVFESVLELILNFMSDVMGEKNARRFFPMIATFSLFIFTCNLMGVFQTHILECLAPIL